MKKGIETFTAIILFFVLISASIIPATPKIASVIVPEPTSELKTPLFFYKGIKIAEVENHLARKLTLWEKISFGLNKKKTIEALEDKPKRKIGIWGIMGIFTGLGLLFSLISPYLGMILLVVAACSMFLGFVRIIERNKMSALGNLVTLIFGGLASFLYWGLLVILLVALGILKV